MKNNDERIIHNIVEAMSAKKGLDIAVMDLSEVSTVADTFIVATGNSDVHMRTLRDAAAGVLDKLNVSYRVEGDNSSKWCLIDAAYLVIHIFSRGGREFYDLERVWGDVPITSVENID